MLRTSLVVVTLLSACVPRLESPADAGLPDGGQRDGGVSLVTAAQLSISQVNAAVLLTPSRAWEWGYVARERPTVTVVTAPRPFTQWPNAVELRGTYFITCARLPGGTVECIGTDAGETHLAPTPIAGLTEVVELAAGTTFACARSAQGAVWCWGRNSVGQVGVGGLPGSWVPHQVFAAGIKRVVAGGQTGCVIDADDHAQCWGEYAFAGPTVAFGGVTVKAVAAGGYEGGVKPCAIDFDGHVRCEPSPGTPLPNIEGATELALGHDHGCALASGGALYCWGHGEKGQLGDGVLHALGLEVAPVAVPGDFTGAHLGDGLGGAHSCVLDSSGWPRCWGDDSEGQLGDGASMPVQLLPTAVLHP